MGRGERSESRDSASYSKIQGQNLKLGDESLESMKINLSITNCRKSVKTKHVVDEYKSFSLCQGNGIRKRKKSNIIKSVNMKHQKENINEIKNTKCLNI